MPVINMTPHAIHIVNQYGDPLVVYPTSGSIVRLPCQTVYVNKTSDGVPLTKTVFGAPIGLPDESEGTFYIVSQLVKTACPERGDLLVPAQVVRKKGVVVGCKSLGV